MKEARPDARHGRTPSPPERADPARGTDREALFARIGPHLEGLRELVGHELAYWEAMGDLIRGELTVEDVVDAVLVRASERFTKDPPRQDIGRWLTSLARQHLLDQAARSKTWRQRTVHVEEDVPETPPTEEVSTHGDEILDFYVPDEDLKVEHVVPDIEVPTPEQEAEAAELRRCTKACLAALPEEWRRALLLRYVRGLTGAKLAQALRRSGKEAEEVVDHARRRLRQHLVDSGCTLRTKP